MRKKAIDIRYPYKVVARGFPVLRFSNLEKAKECFDKFQGPGACMLISYLNQKEVLGYKFI